MLTRTSVRVWSHAVRRNLTRAARGVWAKPPSMAADAPVGWVFRLVAAEPAGADAPCQMSSERRVGVADLRDRGPDAPRDRGARLLRRVSGAAWPVHAVRVGQLGGQEVQLLLGAALRPTSPAESASSSAAEVRGSVQCTRRGPEHPIRSPRSPGVCRPPVSSVASSAGPGRPGGRHGEIQGGHLPTGLRQQDGEVAHTFTVWQMHSGAGVTCPPQRADQGQLGRLHGCCRRPGKSPGACLRSPRSVCTLSRTCCHSCRANASN